MNAQDRRKYWIQFARQQRIIENQYTPKVLKILQNQISSFISTAEIVGWQSAYKHLPIINDELMRVLTSLYKNTGRTFAPQVNRNLRKEKGLGFNQDIIDRIIYYLGSNALSLVTKMDQTTKEELLQIIYDGEQRGLGFREVAKLVEDSWICQKPRALTIVRTESMRAANMSMMEAAKRQKFVVNKIWVSALDIRTRMNERGNEFDHFDLDGVTIGEDEKFKQTGRTGQYAEVMQPGDVTAPPSFTINCRCVLAFESKRDSNGRLIRKA
jgi:hypothetical protein